MIVLDTNVLSEAMKPQPNATVVAWLDTQPIDTLHLTTVTLAELLFGIRALPSGKRQRALKDAFDGLLTLFGSRVLDFDAEAAARYAELAVRAKRAGKGFPLPDGYIAAIAASRGYRIATRDTAPYLAAGLSIIDPWSEPINS